MWCNCGLEDLSETFFFLENFQQVICRCGHKLKELCFVSGCNQHITCYKILNLSFNIDWICMPQLGLPPLCQHSIQTDLRTIIKLLLHSFESSLSGLYALRFSERLPVFLKCDYFIFMMNNMMQLWLSEADIKHWCSFYVEFISYKRTRFVCLILSLWLFVNILCFS